VTQEISQDGEMFYFCSPWGVISFQNLALIAHPVLSGGELWFVFEALFQSFLLRVLLHLVTDIARFLVVADVALAFLGEAPALFLVVCPEFFFMGF